MTAELNIDRTPLVLLDSSVAALDSVRQPIETIAAAQGWNLQIGFLADSAPFDQIVDAQPALIVIMSNQIPDWLIPVSANPATRRIALLAVDVGADSAGLAAIHGAGAARFTPDALTADHLIPLVADPFDRARLIDQCGQPLPPLAIRGIAEFNAQEFFDCHETLETAWRAETGPARTLYRVILQVGLAYYQIERGQYHAALKMFLRTQQWFAQLPTRCQGVDVAQLQMDAHHARMHLETLGPERIAEFDRTLIKPVSYRETP